MREPHCETFPFPAGPTSQTSHQTFGMKGFCPKILAITRSASYNFFFFPYESDPQFGMHKLSVMSNAPFESTKRINPYKTKKAKKRRPESITSPERLKISASYLVNVSIGAAADPLEELVVVLRVPPTDVRREHHGRRGRRGPRTC